MTRTITPHKGGRIIKKSLDVTPETADLLAKLAEHKISLGDLVEEAAQIKTKELTMITATMKYSEFDSTEWELLGKWTDGESTHTEQDAIQRDGEYTHWTWMVDTAKRQGMGWVEMEVQEGDKYVGYGIEALISRTGEFVYIRDVAQAMGCDSHSLYRKKGYWN